MVVKYINNSTTTELGYSVKSIPFLQSEMADDRKFKVGAGTVLNYQCTTGFVLPQSCNVKNRTGNMTHIPVNKNSLWETN